MRALPTENRVCNNCSAEYVWTVRNRFGLCTPCRQSRNQQSTRMKPEDKKKNYPLSHNERNKRYRRLRSDLNKSYNRSEWKRMFNREWDWLMSNGVFEWCTDLRTTTIIRKGSGKIGPLPKGQTDLKLKWPSTKNWDGEVVD